MSTTPARLSTVSGAAVRAKSAWLALAAIIMIPAALLLAYSQTGAFAWDEGYHLVAAMLIKAGKRPYLDFVFPQTPLNTYWNALLMRIFGEGWRVAHAAAALLATGSLAMAVSFVYARFPIARWRLTAALVTGFVIGLNQLFLQFAGVGQAYGMGVFFLMAAFRLAVIAMERERIAYAGAAGLCAGAAAVSSLLTLAASPAILAWLMLYARPGRRTVAGSTFLAGAVAAFTPVIWLFAHGPRQTIFSIIEYQLLFREVDWPGAISHDIGVMLAWVDSGQALVLLSLAAAALLFTWFQRPGTRRERAVWYLCAWIAAAEAAWLLKPHPTFPRYFIFTIPFLGMLAPLGLYVLAARLYREDRPWLPAFCVIVLFAAALGKWYHEDARDAYSWRDIEEVAGKVREVTPPGSSLFADELVYFAAHRMPPPGQELRDSHKLNLSPALAALVHVQSKTELYRNIRAGAFETFETCYPDDYEKLGLAQLYAHHAEFEDNECVVYWGWKSAPHPPSAAGPIS